MTHFLGAPSDRSFTKAGSLGWWIRVIRRTQGLPRCMVKTLDGMLSADAQLVSIYKAMFNFKQTTPYFMFIVINYF
jgi:hypothetical protein